MNYKTTPTETPPSKLYTVTRIHEDLDFGCEERPEGAPTMAIVTLTDESGNSLQLKAEDDLLYQRDINEGDRVCFDTKGCLEKVKPDNPQ